jgi:isopropylmalate/homocitrate/citramalate synthase
VATHCTEADVSEQHITLARKLDMDTVGFLMMSHMNSPEGLVKQAKLMEGYGANCIYVTDSAGHLLPDGVKARLGAVRGPQARDRAGLHGHHNLAMGVANSIAAIEVGATRIDAAAAGLGAGAGNTPMEVLIAVADLMGIETGVDVAKITDVAEDLVVPIMDFPIRIDRDALTLGYAGVYGSFLLFAKRASVKYGVPARDILVELGRRGMVGGQEDMIEDTAISMARARGAGMKLDQATIARLAEHLETCELEARDTPKITDEFPDMDWEDAYAIQDSIRARKLARGTRIVGLKAGLTSYAKMKQMGFDTPCFGFITDYGSVPDGGEVKVSELIHPKIEPEIAFVMKRASRGLGCHIGAVLAATDFVIPGMEVIDSAIATSSSI